MSAKYKFLVSAFCIFNSSFLPAQSPAPSVPVAASFNFGRLEREASVQHSFVITNTGDAPLIITKVRPSCDCLRVMSYPRQIVSKTTGTVLCRLTPDKAGAVAYKLFVESSDPELPVRALVIEGRVTAESSGKKTVSPELNSIAPDLLCRVITRRDHSCYMTAEILKSRLAAGEAIRMIDVRPSSAFNELHAPSSWNVTLFALKTQIQLKSVPLALIDSCGGDPALEQACRDLRKNGFASVWILSGGLNAWRQAGGALEGETAAVKNISLISPFDYSKVRDFSDWLAVYSGAASVRASSLIPEIIFLPLKIANRKSAIENILIVTDNGENYESAISAFAGLNNVNVFYLSGGLAGYENYLRAASAQPATRSLHSGTKTGLARGSPVKKPCGGCPG